MNLISVSSIEGWAGNNNIQYIDGDDKMPFIWKNGLYNYFAFDGTHYVLIMTSIESLNEKRLIIN